MAEKGHFLIQQIELVPPIANNVVEFLGDIG